jgi:glutamate-1-semialdehyde 2,1-aminomutase
MRKIQNKIWVQAQKIIPGGNGLLSKRPERFLMNDWPTYFSKAKGIEVWDLNNIKYIDMSLMGVGTSTLGYTNNYIDKKIFKVIKKGVNTTLNCLEEFQLAKKFLKYDKFADQVKFARGGGEAMSMAIRIARARNQKTKIAFSGYHGWQDWYIAANLENKKNLNNHLLKNLTPLGIPKELKGSTIPFKFNDFDEISKIAKSEKLSAIVIECGRYNYLSKDFVKKINQLCNKKKICLIVDEITTGWRETNGGVYQLLNLKPDIVVYGKSIGNGYAISAVVGKKKYMKFANKTFVSSVAWTERVGFTAGISVIDFFTKKKVAKHLLKMGDMIRNGWIESAKKNKILIEIGEMKAIPTFRFKYGLYNEKLYTIFTYLMMKEKYLATNSIYLSYKHNRKNIKKYLIIIDKIFKKMGNIIKNKKSLNKIKVRKYNY